MYDRYRKFSRVKFGIIPEDGRWWFLQQLLPYEAGLVYGSKIGLAEEFSYYFRIKDARPIR